MNIEKNWKDHSHMAIDHWGAPKSEPTAEDLTDDESFKNFLMTAYSWTSEEAAEEIKWFSDFTRTFESK